MSAAPVQFTNGTFSGFDAQTGRYIDYVAAAESITVTPAALLAVVTAWLRDTRHGSQAACVLCPVDAAGLVARVAAAGLL